MYSSTDDWVYVEFPARFSPQASMNYLKDPVEAARFFWPREGWRFPMYQPPFCPNPACKLHHRAAAAQAGQFWDFNGFYLTAVSGLVRRYRCRACAKGFSKRTLSIDYYTKKTLDYHEIHRALSASESLSSIARHLGCSPASVQNRIDRLGRNCIAAQARILSSAQLSEDLCADGFESFDRSQFFPNAINIMVGTRSQFLYGATHTTLRRKGRMTPSQRRTRERYDQLFRPHPGALVSSFSELLGGIEPIWDKQRLPKLVLRTDEHRSYPSAVRRVPKLAAGLRDHSFSHERYSSKAPRTPTTPLFPVNYYDRELRKDIAAFRRESTCFTRNVSNGLMRFMGHLVWHNYRTCHRIKWNDLAMATHAQAAGLDSGIIEQELERLYRERAFLSHQMLTDEQIRMWLKLKLTPLKTKPDYLQHFARMGCPQASIN
jgi:hypothetical protein